MTFFLNESEFIDMSNTTSEFKSRWGFHPCSLEQFLQLQRLHRWYWKTVYDFHRWHRWWRKEEQNRVGPEPKFCPHLVEDRVWFKPVEVRGEPGFKVYPKTVVDHGVLALYRQARTPLHDPVDPWDDRTLKIIDSLDLKLTEYFDE